MADHIVFQNRQLRDLDRRIRALAEMMHVGGNIVEDRARDRRLFLIRLDEIEGRLAKLEQYIQDNAEPIFADADGFDDMVMEMGRALPGAKLPGEENGEDVNADVVETLVVVDDAVRPCRAVHKGFGRWTVEDANGNPARNWPGWFEKDEALARAAQLNVPRNTD